MRSLLVVAALLLLGACDDAPAADTRDASVAGDLPDCSGDGCAGELEAYADRVRALPGVTSYAAVYRPAQTTDLASVGGDLVVADGTDCAALGDELGRLLWLSRVSPVGSVDAHCFAPGATGSDYEHAAFSFALKDAGDLERRWGARGSG